MFLCVPFRILDWNSDGHYRPQNFSSEWLHIVRSVADPDDKIYGSVPLYVDFLHCVFRRLDSQLFCALIKRLHPPEVFWNKFVAQRLCYFPEHYDCNIWYCQNARVLEHQQDPRYLWYLDDRYVVRASLRTETLQETKI